MANLSKKKKTPPHPHSIIHLLNPNFLLKLDDHECETMEIPTQEKANGGIKSPLRKLGMFLGILCEMRKSLHVASHRDFEIIKKRFFSPGDFPV